jgi:broad specificity phosphatase PhoE
VIYLVRHGETAHNRDGLGLGRDDVPLTEVGVQQARAVGERFEAIHVARIFSSPLQRARIVADEVGTRLGVDVEVVPHLTELDVGETEGLGFAEMRQRYPDFLAHWGGAEGHLARMPGGESMADLASRLEPLALSLLAQPESDPAMVVSHNFVLRALLCRLLGLEVAKFRSFELGLASVSTVLVRNGRAHVRNINDTCHLANLNLA